LTEHSRRSEQHRTFTSNRTKQSAPKFVLSHNDSWERLEDLRNLGQAQPSQLSHFNDEEFGSFVSSKGREAPSEAVQLGRFKSNFAREYLHTVESVRRSSRSRAADD
jgi:hypothetical protein